MLTIVLQAGGLSTRMGRDKALMPFLGIPLIERLRDRLLILNREILIISNDFSGYEYLGLPLYKDVIPDRGALGGLLTALTISNTPFVGLIAADMPFASPQLLTHLLELIQYEEGDAALPSTKSSLEPLHGVYRCDTCLPLVKDAIKRDLWRMRSWHDQANILTLSPQKTTEVTGNTHTFTNLNTPEDFSAAEDLAKKTSLI